MTLTTLNNAKGQSQYKENYINKYKYIGKHYILSKYFTTKKQTLNFLVHVVFWEKNLSPCSISKLFMPPPPPRPRPWTDQTWPRTSIICSLDRVPGLCRIISRISSVNKSCQNTLNVECHPSPCRQLIFVKYISLNCMYAVCRYS